ncbi:MAG: WXG100 family type VII secretion target [Gordonia sp. (in: high G+C Gram-positive bacteria)]
MNGGVIKYNYAGLGTLSGDLKAQFGRLEELAGQLKRQVGSLSSHWDSNGSSQYQAAQANWDRLFADARLRLDGLGSGVAKASQRMQETDGRVGKMFTT